MKYIVTLNGKDYEVDVEEYSAAVVSVKDSAGAQAAQSAPAVPQAVAPGAGTQVTSPMPGTIVEVRATPGAIVRRGDVLFILEAMKMENDVVAPTNGTVKQILVEKGASVDTGAVLAVI